MFLISFLCFLKISVFQQNHDFFQRVILYINLTFLRYRFTIGIVTHSCKTGIAVVRYTVLYIATQSM